MEVVGGRLAAKKCKLQLLAFDFNTYSYQKHYPSRGQPHIIVTENQDGDCLLFDGDLDDYIVVEELEPTKGQKLLGVRLAADGNCLDEFKAQKDQSERLVIQLLQSSATPVDAYMIYIFRYCPAVFYCIPVTYFTPA